MGEEKAVAESGGEHDPELGARVASWGVTATDRRLGAVVGVGGLAGLVGLVLLATAEAWSGLALVLVVVGAGAGLLGAATRPREGTSFEVFEHGLSDGARTLLFRDVVSTRFEAVDEVTEIGGAETARETRYEAEIEGPDGVVFRLRGVDDEAEACYRALLERLGDPSA